MTRPTASYRVSLSARMCSSGWGFSTAACLMSSRSSPRSLTPLPFQYICPLASTSTTTFSGFVCVGMFTAVGSLVTIVFEITGIVIRKIMSNTSITSTSGVVLIVELSSVPSSAEEPTFIAIVKYLRPSALRSGSKRYGHSRSVTCEPQPQARQQDGHHRQQQPTHRSNQRAHH